MKRVLLLAAAIITAGCSTVVNSHRQKSGMMNSYLKGDNAGAESVIDKKLSSGITSAENSGDELMWRLEAGSLNFHTGDFNGCLESLNKAENLMHNYDDRATVSARKAGAEVAAAATNMNALPYRGFCRDRMALSIYKSMAYLGVDKEESFRAQLHRLRDEQVKVQEDYRKFFEKEKAEVEKSRKENPEAAKKMPQGNQTASNAQNADFNKELNTVKQVANKGYGNFLNPAAIYLSGLGSLRDGNYDNARIDFKRIYEAMPYNAMAQQCYVTSLKLAGRAIPAELAQVKPFDFPLDHDCVYILFANGRSAAFKQIAVYFPVMTAWPICEFYDAPFTRLDVTADGKTSQSMQLADMDAILAQEYDERLVSMITRITLNALIKEVTYYALLHSNKNNTGAWIAIALGGAAYRIAMNTADTRSWEILPKEFQLVQVPMPKERKLQLHLLGRADVKQDIQLPDGCRSAIVYVGAPSASNVKCHVLPMKSK